MPDPNNLPSCACQPGTSPSLGDKLDNIYCILLAIANGGGVGGGVAQFANAAARAAATPLFEGQLGYQVDTSAYYRASGTGVGNWDGSFIFGGGSAPGTIAIVDGAGRTGTIQLDTLTGSNTYSLPDTTGTVDVTP